MSITCVDLIKVSTSLDLVFVYFESNLGLFEFVNGRMTVEGMFSFW